MKLWVKLLAICLVSVMIASTFASCSAPLFSKSQTNENSTLNNDIVVIPPNSNGENGGNGSENNGGSTSNPVTPPAKAPDVLVSTPVTPDADYKVPEGGVNLGNETASATVPGGVQLDEGATELSLTINGIDESAAKIELSESEVSTSFDVHMTGVAASNLVPMEIKLLAAAAKGLNSTSIKLYHVENGVTIEMTRVSNGTEFTSHNQFKYDPATGDITLYMASFSEVAMVTNTENAWKGNRDYTWYDANATELFISNADQLAGFGAIVGGMDGQVKDNFDGKTVTLLADINLGDKESENNPNLIFYPIGYYNDEGTYEKTETAITSNVSAFRGTFDGNGHTIANFYQNTWEMKGDNSHYDARLQYYNDAMGLFGYVFGATIKNLTVDSFSSDGEYTPTGVIAAYAVNSNFENIAIKNCNPRVYNTGNGGIIGIAGRENSATDKITMKNITVDNTNKISALWGSYDVACGGLIGMYRGNADGSGDTIEFTNCHVSAQLDVYNDVCANYQYYAYRYAGMIIGSIRSNITVNGNVYPNMTGISASGCTVHFGTWNDYYYCEFEKNSMASYSEDFQFSRVPHSELNFTDTNENGIIDTEEERNSVTGCKHEHTEEEDKQAVYLPFHNLFTGYGWGVTSMAINGWHGFDILDVTEGDHEASVEKFEGKLNELVNEKEYTLGDIFNFVDNGVELVPGALTVTITNLDENGNVIANITYNTNDWANGTITLTGAGTIQITIQDYYFCVPTTIIVTVIAHDHEYDHDCDTTCNICGAIREVGEHVYDNACDKTCNECEAERDTEHTAGEEVVENNTAPGCENTGSYDNVVYCTVCGEELSRETITVNATGHTAGNIVVENEKAADCENTGSYDNVVYCTVCDDEISRETITVNATGHTPAEAVKENEVPATCTKEGSYESVVNCSTCRTEISRETKTIDKIGHTPGAAATCTTEQTCTVCGSVLTPALGHSYNSVVTAPTCENGGYTTHTCANCGDKYTDNEVDALGHISKKFTGDFLYRVGNQNAVQLSSLFDVRNHSVTVKYENISGSASVTINGTSLKFNGTGVVKVTLTSDCDCGECELELKLEVVDAFNATSATSAKDKNVVLLQNVGFSTIEVSGGYTLYGNGFTMTCGSDSPVLDFGYSFVTLNNGTLDNVQIVCPNFDYAALYKENLTSGDNRSQTTDKTRYYNAMSAINVSGNSQILNSRISGGRAAVNVTGGNCLIDNSRIELGAVASLLVGSANSVTLRDVTLVQKPTASTHDSNKVLMGFSVLFICDSNGNAAPITIEGTLVQDAWVNETYKNYVPSAGSSVITNVMKKTEYLHDLDGDGENESLNLGFAFMPESENSSVKSTNITDNRTNQDQIPYKSTDVTVIVFTTKVYSYLNSNGTAESFKNLEEYTPNKQGDIITVSYDDTKDGLEQGKSYGTDGWVYELNVDLDKASGYKLDFSKLTMNVNGVSVTDYKVNGSAKPSSPIAVTAGGATYTLTATIDGKEYTATFKVTGTETSKESPSKISGPTTAGFGVAKSYGSDWSGAADVLTGVKIKYWSVAENKYVEFDFSDFTVPGNAGKLNGANSYWEYTHTNNDFTLKVTNTVAIHSGKSVYGMPIRGTDGKLYFTISSTNGYVGSGTTTRAVTMQYEFTDNNGGDKLTFTHTFNISYDKDNQYSYSDLSGSGKLTKLEGSSGGGGCVTPETLITLADGTQVRVDSLTGNEMLLVWNMETGKLDVAPIMFLDSDPTTEYEVVRLYFSDGTSVNVIYEHGFWDYDLNRYVYLDENAADYIGHTFAKQNGDKLEKVQLVDVVIETETTTAWSPVTVGHLCYFVNGMLSMPGGVGGLFNIFEVDPETMTYDYEQIAKDIETYGLFTYEELNAICPLTEEMFNAAGGAYLKISIGKGNLTIEELIAMITRYSKYI